MRDVIVDSLPKCDLCGKKTATYDAPTRQGPWANMCTSCYEKFGIRNGTGSKLKTRGTMTGSSTPLKGTDTWNGDERLVTCPSCGHEHLMEPDASGTFVCHDCNQMIWIDSLI